MDRQCIRFTDVYGGILLCLRQCDPRLIFLLARLSLIHQSILPSTLKGSISVHPQVFHSLILVISGQVFLEVWLIVCFTEAMLNGLDLGQAPLQITNCLALVYA
ncbi:hypothetical protein LguiA_004584 [Lonicera macranthoides]